MIGYNSAIGTPKIQVCARLCMARMNYLKSFAVIYTSKIDYKF